MALRTRWRSKRFSRSDRPHLDGLVAGLTSAVTARTIIQEAAIMVAASRLGLDDHEPRLYCVHHRLRFEPTSPLA